MQWYSYKPFNFSISAVSLDKLRLENQILKLGRYENLNLIINLYLPFVNFWIKLMHSVLFSYGLDIHCISSSFPYMFLLLILLLLLLRLYLVDHLQPDSDNKITVVVNTQYKTSTKTFLSFASDNLWIFLGIWEIIY